MVQVRFETLRPCRTAGKKVWITGTDNELFGAFWDECHATGLVDRLKALRKTRGAAVPGVIMGVSRVERDPNNRSFDFYVAAETDECPPDLELCDLPGGEYAVFRACGALPDALIQAEMHAFMTWLPASEYIHDHRPEIELYPEWQGAPDQAPVEFWLPIVKKA